MTPPADAQCGFSTAFWMHFIALLFQKDDKEFTVAVFSNSAPVTLNFLTLEVLQLDACELRDYPIWISVFVLICQNSGHQQLTFAKTRENL